MHVVVGGSSGFLGTHLVAALERDGHTVTRLVRRAASGPHESRWDPANGHVDAQVIETADVVVNLAGSPTIGNPHSKKWARELRESRVTSTRTLARAIAAAQSKPAFLAGNAIAIYGDHGAQPVTEDSDSRGDQLMTSVTRDWQDAAEEATGTRLVLLRTAPVLDVRSAPLKQLRLLFKAGLGGRIGDGKQYFPVISLRDWVAAVVHLVASEVSGPVNLCCEHTPTNAEFTQALARAVRRPALAPVPAPLIKIGAGPLAPELLGSVNLVPQALLDSGFAFADPDVAAVLASGLAARD